MIGVRRGPGGSWGHEKGTGAAPRTGGLRGLPGGGGERGRGPAERRRLKLHQVGGNAGIFLPPHPLCKWPGWHHGLMQGGHGAATAAPRARAAPAASLGGGRAAMGGGQGSAGHAEPAEPLPARPPGTGATEAAARSGDPAGGLRDRGHGRGGGPWGGAAGWGHPRPPGQGG